MRGTPGRRRRPINQVTLIGYLGQDPEIRSTSSGATVANLSLATSSKYKDKATGEQKEATEWHRVVCWNEGLADIIQRYLVKGSRIMVQGELRTRKWQDQSGQDRYATEVVLAGYTGRLEMLGGKEAPKQAETHHGASEGQQQALAPPPGDDGLDDEIPFD